jgi:Rrf2 family protein
MKLSKKGEYALRALIDLGIASEVGRSLIQVTELAEHEKLPIKFLEQIMTVLKEAGLIESQRGKFGGYRLAQPPGKIMMGHVIRLIDGPLAPIACVSQTAYEKCSCPDETHCGLRMLMLDVRNAITNILDRYSLADVVEVTLRKMRRDGVPLPYSEPRHAPRSAGQPRKHARAASATRMQPIDGLINNLLVDYAI